MATDDDEGEVQKGQRHEGIQGDEEVPRQGTEPVAELLGVVGDKAQQPEKKKREKKEPVVLVREIGKSLLPVARVQKIIKADKDIPLIAKDATFLISLATEEFIKRLSEAGRRVAEREKRSTVQHKDIATVVRRAGEFMFLEETIPWLSSELMAKRKPKGASSGINGAPTLLDEFVITSKGIEDEGAEESDVVMNEDGTMDSIRSESNI